MSTTSPDTQNVPVFGLSIPQNWIYGLLIIIVVSYGRQSLFSYGKAGDTNITKLGGISILNARDFFRKRFDFLMANFQKTGEPMFSFNVLQVSSTTFLA